MKNFEQAWKIKRLLAEMSYYVQLLINPYQILTNPP